MSFRSVPRFCPTSSSLFLSTGNNSMRLHGPYYLYILRRGVAPPPSRTDATGSEWNITDSRKSYQSSTTLYTSPLWSVRCVSSSDERSVLDVWEKTTNPVYIGQGSWRSLVPKAVSPVVFWGLRLRKRCTTQSV